MVAILAETGIISFAGLFHTILTLCNSMSRADKKRTCAGQAEGPGPRPGSSRYDLVSDQTTFKSREDVRERLPEILGKALALIWIDREFADLVRTRSPGNAGKRGIILPENMAIEFQKPGTDRPRVVVYEKRPNSNFKLRILYLQLVMMAGR